MPELRYNPINDQWIIVATNRQQRPHLPGDGCPFCDHPHLPKTYHALAYPNDFPALTTDASPPAPTIAHPLYQSKKAYGKCEVILYSSDHHAVFHQLSLKQAVDVMKLWKQRYQELAQDPQIKYIFEFENKGTEVGVTIHHPHGQLYAYPFLPPKIKTELQQTKKYFKKHGRKLFQDLLEQELQSTSRLIYQNAGFVCFIPYFTDYPFGVYIVSRRGRSNLSQMEERELEELAECIQKVTAGFDRIYERPFPYIMCFHQTPVNLTTYRDADDYYTFHIEFYPPLRAKDKIKWYAGSEMGASVAANPLDVDACASILRSKIL